MYSKTGKRDRENGSDEPGSYSTDIDAIEGINQSTSPHDSEGHFTTMSVNKLRECLFEGGSGSLRVIGTLSTHREKTPSESSKSPAVPSELMMLYPDVIKVMIDDIFSRLSIYLSAIGYQYS